MGTLSWMMSDPYMMSKAKGKGNGGKGKKGAPPPSDPYWQKKMSDENRQEGDGTTYSGKIHGYNHKHGWGFILPDAPQTLPVDVQQALMAAKMEAESKGKTIEHDYMIYFRSPDLLCEAQKDIPVTFQLYYDNKGVGAHTINASG